ncbi:MAG: ATP-binding protein [Candidatus Pseudobacter hemicellulosilyticus]|uniref:histidine kinase n=1 Tax=Candidatus Pseudobacter hemicellulosilyticus TaxID=3121375 RepID=A0AAJ5WP77_9BACT|nr:MAG: ATP-binding protein [Pseudobacter sp.]
MPVRLRITLLFGMIVFTILALVCGAVYYFYYTNRQNDIRTRLTNRAITTGRLLQQSDLFDRELLQRIDASTTITMKYKSVQVYDYQNKPVYIYSDVPGDTVPMDPDILNQARLRETKYFRSGRKDVVAYHFVDADRRIVILSGGYDEDGLKKLQQLELILWSCFLGGTLVAFGAGYFFSSRLLHPIRKIADDINEISARNLARRMETGKVADEWSYLSETLNQLLNRLQESFEIQRRFISNASHELSTPLTAISSQLEVSLQKNREASHYRGVMESVYQDVQNLSKLTQTLLEFATASDDPGGLDIELIRMDEILMRLPAEVNKLKPGYTVALLFENLPEKEDRLIVAGNAELLFSAIKNLVSNACKYSGEHKAYVKLATRPGGVVITISDHGIGIPKEELPFIFQPFFRAHNTYPESGFGLGLSLCHRIIKLHKGDIAVASEVGEGSSFTIVLPAIGKL